MTRDYIDNFPPQVASNMDEPLTNLLFEYPGADIILRSHDTHHFRVPKSYIVNNSPVLDELIRKALGPSDDAHGASLPIFKLPETGATLHTLLTFIFPVIPLLPSTAEKSMELLSVAHKYQMDSVLALIRFNIARDRPPITQRDSAFSMYSLAHKYGLHQEALQAARSILYYPLNFEDLEDRLDMMSGASVYELWKYSEKVRPILASDLMEFRKSGANGILTGLHCLEHSSSQIPRWLDHYIASLGNAPNLFDIFEFNTTMARHVHQSQNNGCSCGSIPTQTIRNFWEALASVLDGSFEKVV
jgi:BTB/POZ domain